MLSVGFRAILDIWGKGKTLFYAARVIKNMHWLTVFVFRVTSYNMTFPCLVCFVLLTYQFYHIPFNLLHLKSQADKIELCNKVLYIIFPLVKFSYTQVFSKHSIFRHLQMMFFQKKKPYFTSIQSR